MPFRTAFLSAMVLAPFALLTGAPAPAERVTVAQVQITRSFVIRIPGWRRTPAGNPAAVVAGTQFKERKGPRCIDAATIGGAAISAPDSVDFTLKGGQRVRAKLEDECPALDYYSGFYVVPPPDGKICADRDAIHTRSGAECGIDKFRALTPVSLPPKTP